MFTERYLKIKEVVTKALEKGLENHERNEILYKEDFEFNLITIYVLDGIIYAENYYKDEERHTRIEEVDNDGPLKDFYSNEIEYLTKGILYEIIFSKETDEAMRSLSSSTGKKLHDFTKSLGIEELVIDEFSVVDDSKIRIITNKRSKDFNLEYHDNGIIYLREHTLEEYDFATLLSFAVFGLVYKEYVLNEAGEDNVDSQPDPFKGIDFNTVN